MAPNDKTAATPPSTFNVPKWLNEDYFADILKAEYGEYKIKDFTVKPAMAKGENFASIMYRVLIDVELKYGRKDSISYITKALPESGMTEEMIKNMSLFPKEIEMYDSIVPKLEKLLNQAGVKLKFSPDCLKSSLDTQCFTMEDLNRKNFMNAKRQLGLDLKHTKYALSKLAKFHAASAVLVEKEGPMEGHFLEGVFKESLRPLFDQMMVTMKKVFDECVKQWDVTPLHAKKIVGSFEDVYSKMMKCVAIDPNGFNVLNHGDMWTNNIMYQYDCIGNIQEMLFVDLQLCKYGSPAQDLFYFLISSCNSEIKTKEFDHLIKYYHDELIACLQLLKYSKPLPRLIDVHCDMLQRGFFAVSTATGVMSIVLCDVSENADMENFMKDDENGTQFKKDLYLNPNYIKAMRLLLPWLDNKGFLD